jgi:hypothetical protein
VFALPETFHGDYPPHEPKTGIFTGVFPCELQIIKISSVSFRSKRGLLLMFQHEEGRAGIRGEYPVLFSRENLPLLLSDPGSYRTGHKKPEKAGACCRNTNPEPLLLPYRMGFL